MRLAFLDMADGESRVEPGFRPQSVAIDMGGKRWAPEWQLVSDMPYEYEPGEPKHWCTDGHRIYFDRPAKQACRVTASTLPELEK